VRVRVRVRVRVLVRVLVLVRVRVRVRVRGVRACENVRKRMHVCVRSSVSERESGSLCRCVCLGRAVLTFKALHKDYTSQAQDIPRTRRPRVVGMFCTN